MSASTTSEWTSVDVTDCASTAADVTIEAWLVAAGLAKQADQIMEACDAECVEDFGLLSAESIEALVNDVGLKLVSAEKLRRAVAGLKLAQPEAGSKAEEADKVSDAQAGDTKAEGATTSEHPSECIAICIDRSGSMGAPFAEVTLNHVAGAVTERTRMEAVKAMFYAFRDRVESLGDGARGMKLGLLQFDHEVITMMGLTSRFDRFESIVDDLCKRGQTAIFSAIIAATEMLQPVFDSSQQTDLRVLCLTDGNSNNGATPQAALAAAHRIGAVVDAIIVGDSPDANLRKIVAATGGLCFQIRTLGEGFELLEGEGVASLRARRGGTDKPPFTEKPLVDFGAIAGASFAMAAPVAAPATAQLAKKKVVSVATRVATLDGGSGGTATAGAASAAASAGASAAAKRVLKELRSVATHEQSVWLHSGEGVHIFPAESDLLTWRVLIEGPAGSPFEGGTFALSVVLRHDYPLRAPTIRFETPVYHCNVSDSGQICLGVLQDDWSPALSVPKALEAIRLMLAQPDTDNALRQWIAELTLAYIKNGADTRYADEARRRTRLDAGRSVADWEKEWGAAA